MNKNTNIGVQLFPSVLVVAAVAYYRFGNWGMAGFSFFLAVVFWLVLYAENK